jgi:hypothetical protein
VYEDDLAEIPLLKGREPPKQKKSQDDIAQIVEKTWTDVLSRCKETYPMKLYTIFAQRHIFEYTIFEDGSSHKVEAAANIYEIYNRPTEQSLNAVLNSLKQLRDRLMKEFHPDK